MSHQPRHSDTGDSGQSGIPDDLAPDWPPSAERSSRSPFARPAPPICSRDIAAVVSPGRTARPVAAGPGDISRSHPRQRHLLVSEQHARTDAGGWPASGTPVERYPMKSPANLALLLEGFFTRRLMAQRQASPHTIGSYRDTFRLLLNFAEQRLKRPPSKLALEDLGTPLITSFLDELEKHRANTARSRNLRLAAIRSFFRYAALEAPEHSALIQRVLSIPRKRR